MTSPITQPLAPQDGTPEVPGPAPGLSADLPADLTPLLPPVEDRIATELAVPTWKVRAAVELLDGGATVPFVARYRKEVTGSLDDAQLRTLQERLGYLRELEERRLAVLESVHSQGKLDHATASAIWSALTKARLEDVYLPFKPRRRTKAQIAREAGLEPLADLLLAEPAHSPQAAAGRFVDHSRGVADGAAALDGARAILAERFGEDADLVGEMRERMWRSGVLISVVQEGKQESGAKFADYFAFSEPLTKLPSHRILALFRGEKEGVLTLNIDPGEDEDAARSSYELSIAHRFGVADRGRPADRWLLDAVRWAWRTRISVYLDVDLRARLWQVAEDEALRVFAGNLRDLLLAAPAGARTTMGLDPGLRTGVKVAVVDPTGKVVATETVYPHVPHKRWAAALDTLAELVHRHDVQLVAIGNGTASRETDKLAGELIAKVHGRLVKAVVSEAGASVYSASSYASAELPELDVSLRGAVSIARRLQDPLAELVKIDPKSIGVGQYQHDLSGARLSRSLDAVVEDCVNAVGVDLNTASVPLLRRVSGVSESLAAAIVAHRDANGPFGSRTALREVPRLGPKAFEQCAGFLRIRDGDDPLDSSGVHPEAYPVVRKILSGTAQDVASLIGDTQALRALKAEDFVDDRFGLPTVTDILAELEKPGRDPRPAFAAATFADGVETIDDLRRGMVLEGVVTNVAAFGAFVDVGVHQDGLVHISEMSQTFVNDPREVAKPGDVVRVKVLDVDVPRKRIALSLRLEDDVPGVKGDAGPGSHKVGAGRHTHGGGRPVGDRTVGDRTAGDKPVGDKAAGDKAGGEKAGDKAGGGKAAGPRERAGGRPHRGARGDKANPAAHSASAHTTPPGGEGPGGHGPGEGKPSDRRGKPEGRPGRADPKDGVGPERQNKRSDQRGEPRRGGDQHGGDRPGRGRPAATPSGAIAEAFRRAGWDQEGKGG